MKLPVLALATLLAVSGCAADPADSSADERRERAVDRSTPAGGERPHAQGPSEPTGESSSPSEASFAAAVYYLGDTERAGVRLYREFRRLSGEDHLTAAVNAALGAGENGRQLAPLDGDYRTAWPALTVADTSFDGGVLRVDLGGDPESDLRRRARGMTQQEAEQSVQQLVYTAQATVQTRAPVRFSIHGRPTNQVLGVPTPGPVRQGSPLQVLSHVSLTSPEQGGAARDTLRVSGVGNSFEANLGWEIRQGDQVVRRGFVTAEGWMGDRLFPFETSVDVSGLDPGRYTLWVTTDDPSGGTEGIGAMTDDRDFTIG